ncbi:hypothetical protein LZ31DRAFT_169852 [Colletotrichum somersetense]|nr:hypothetical protein LZ31DRAFT_169852 [Colletotrichum somersetense]
MSRRGATLTRARRLQGFCASHSYHVSINTVDLLLFFLLVSLDTQDDKRRTFSPISCATLLPEQPEQPLQPGRGAAIRTARAHTHTHTQRVVGVSMTVSCSGDSGRAAPPLRIPAVLGRDRQAEEGECVDGSRGPFGISLCIPGHVPFGEVGPVARPSHGLAFVVLLSDTAVVISFPATRRAPQGCWAMMM